MNTAAAWPTSIAQMEQLAELDAYRSQPAQMPAAAHGKVGLLQLRFERRQGRSVLAHLHRISPLLVQQALYWDEAMPELPICMILSVGGGTLQGDRLSIEVDVAAAACAQVTTQGATRLHAMDANYALQAQNLSLGPGAYLEFMPEVVIPYRHTRYASQTHVMLDESATLLLSEFVMPGRLHHAGGERFEYRQLSFAVRVFRPDGRLVFSEKLLIDPALYPLSLESVMHGLETFGTLLVLTPAEVAQRIRARAVALCGVDLEAGWVSGVVALPDQLGLMFRVVARQSEQVRQQIRAIWQICREEAVGRTLPTEFAWR
ncbi:urease accessory protein UreD [Curvibacter sp. HBC61]|uniref:Urease accessory protein UreD n=1 Tax=Curvibacter cyanobacteriorum TaxID=3026422 RepID=A0ABT5N5D1_9BURK|nr:urease accessory protein UreD [Curvibacter sp. HBC61]MDD0840681.1 urease accessory protein UreD [Curvibacter sp. HBC61]